MLDFNDLINNCMLVGHVIIIIIIIIIIYLFPLDKHKIQYI